MPRLKWSLLVLAIAYSPQILVTAINAEHKIHNIVLYPDKHSWCKTTEIKQIVEHPGCSSVEIDNNVCVGACFSYSIPISSPSAPSDVIAPYCDSCQPAHYTWKQVRLNCQSESDSEESSVVEMLKKVQVIRNCSCTACDSAAAHSHHHAHPEVEATDLPEIINLMVPRNVSTHAKQTDEDKEKFNKVLNILLQKKEMDNGIEVDEEKEKLEEHEQDEGEDKLELLEERAEEKPKEVEKPHTHLEEGPHHSLIIKPDVVPEHHESPAVKNHEVQQEEDEEVPSLLKNQFKVHEHEEYLDQIAVESRKEYRDEPSEVILSVPELIYKEAEVEEHKPSESSEVEPEEEDEELVVPSLLHENAPKIVKIAEVDHDHLSPAVEGAQVSYMNHPKE